MDKYCERCYARDAKPYMECNACNPGHRNFRPAPTLKPTHADRIRSMSDEELAKFLIHESEDHAYLCCDCCTCGKPGMCTEDTDCKSAVLGWLHQPAEKR